MSGHARRNAICLRADVALEDSAAFQILDTLSIAVFVLEKSLRIRYRNAAARAWFLGSEDVASIFAGARWFSAFPGWAEVLEPVWQRGESINLNAVIPLGGLTSPSLVALECQPFQVVAPSRTDFVVLAVHRRDSSEGAEDRLEVSARLASLGKLATRVAHELNNPLDGILRYVNLSLKLVGNTPESKLQSYLSESRTGLMRMFHIISDLLEFSRRTDGEFDERTINEVVEEAVRATAFAAEDNHVIVALDFQHREMPRLRGSRLYQVCCNLMKNAIDAMPGGGRLCITTGIAEGCAILRVADTGNGLPNPAERVFEPFFTTKAPGKGTGLGLAICKEFIEDMGGTITAARREDQGTVFTIRIPLSRCAGSTSNRVSNGNPG